MKPWRNSVHGQLDEGGVVWANWVEAVELSAMEMAMLGSVQKWNEGGSRSKVVLR